MSLLRVLSTSRHTALKAPASLNEVGSIAIVRVLQPSRCFSYLTPISAKSSGFFSWDIFKRKSLLPKTPEPTVPAVPLENKETTPEWSNTDEQNIDQIRSSKNKSRRYGFPARYSNGQAIEFKKISHSQLKTIITKKVVAYHPEASATDDFEKLESLSLTDAKVKFQILSDIMTKCQEISNSNKYDYPNRNLNNTETVKDIFGYYFQSKDRFDISGSHNVQQFLKTLKKTSLAEQTPLPSNIQYVPSEISPRFAPRPVAPLKKHRQNRRGMRQHLIPRYGPNN